jgi:glutathione S-transferase
MKLVFTPNPEYIHKVLVVAHEAGISDRLTFERTRPFAEDTSIWKFNPFGKVPVLIMDNGDPLFGGLVICEYFDSLSVTGKSVYPKGDARWPALRQMMLGEYVRCNHAAARRRLARQVRLEPGIHAARAAEDD